MEKESGNGLTLTQTDATKIVEASEKILQEDCERIESHYSRHALTQKQAKTMLGWADARHRARIAQWLESNFVPPQEG